MDINLYDKCNKEYTDKMRSKDTDRETAQTKWLKIKAMAADKGVVVKA